jgi:rare lipoprotein A
MVKSILLSVVALLSGFALSSAQLKKPLVQQGKASYYGREFEGRRTANGEFFRNADFTAAHRKLPFNTLVRVTNLRNQLSITVRINDRGPFVKGRIIDLSEASARRIGSYMHGLSNVRVEEVRLLKITEEIDSLFTNYNFLDCLGNPEEAEGISISLWKTKNLLHMLYVANELYLHDDISRVFIAGKGSGNNRTYFLVLSGYDSNKEAQAAIERMEKKGFMKVTLYK